MTASYVEMRRNNLCGVETTPGGRCVRGFAHPGQPHVDQDVLAQAIREQAPNRAQVGGKTVTPEDAAAVMVDLLGATS